MRPFRVKGACMPIRIAVSGLFVAVSLATGTLLAADPPPRILARLDYRAPGDRCPAERALHREVELRLGYDPFTADASMRVVARIEHQEGTLSGEIGAFTGAAKAGWSKSFRVTEGACAALLVKMGIAISFYLDPLIFFAEAPTRSLPENRPAEATKPPTEEALRPRREKPRLSFDLGLGPQLAIGAAGPAFSMLGHVGARWSMLSLGLELRHDAPRSIEAAAPLSELRVRASAIGGSLVPCGHLSDFFGCALLSAGRMSIDVRGAEVPQGGPDRPYLGAGARLGFERRFLPWLGLRLHGEVLFMLRSAEVAVGSSSMDVPVPLASWVNGAFGGSLLAYFSP